MRAGGLRKWDPVSTGGAWDGRTGRVYSVNSDAAGTIVVVVFRDRSMAAARLSEIRAISEEEYAVAEVMES